MRSDHIDKLAAMSDSDKFDFFILSLSEARINRHSHPYILLIAVILLPDENIDNVFRKIEERKSQKKGQLPLPI